MRITGLKSDLIHFHSIYNFCPSIFFHRDHSQGVKSKIDGLRCWPERGGGLSARIGHFGKHHNTLFLSPQILHNYCSQFLLGFRMVPRENKNNAYAKFGGTNKDCYGIFRNGLFVFLTWQRTCGFPITISNAWARVIATLNLLGLLRNPMVWRTSEQTKEALERTC